MDFPPFLYGKKLFPAGYYLKYLLNRPSNPLP